MGNLRDLRSDKGAKPWDDQRYEVIATDRNKMHAFEKSLGEQKVKQIVVCLRELGKQR
jgi:hypothetical protein